MDFLKCEVEWIADGTATEGLADGTAQKRQQTWESDNTVRRGSHWVEVCRMDSEMSRLVEQPWLQLMCCAVCLLRGRNFR